MLDGVHLHLHLHANRQGVDITFIVCVFFCLFVCVVTDFFAEYKANGVRFCIAVHQRPRQGISHFGEVCSPEDQNL